MSHVFISYIRENSDKIDRLVMDLESYGVDIWLDRSCISPGVKWKTAIRKAIQGGAYFIACFSSEYNRKDRTYMNEEVLIAIEELRLRTSDRAWFIPVKLDKCSVSDFEIGAGETLESIQYIDLSDNWSDGVRKIASSVKKKA